MSCEDIDANTYVKHYKQQVAYINAATHTTAILLKFFLKVTVLILILLLWHVKLNIIYVRISVII